MSADVETMFYTREKPWHGLGTKVMEAPDSEGALIAAGLNWTVSQNPIYTGGNVIEGYHRSTSSLVRRLPCTWYFSTAMTEAPASAQP